jgi:hypothetical protein
VAQQAWSYVWTESGSGLRQAIVTAIRAEYARLPPVALSPPAISPPGIARTMLHEDIAQHVARHLVLTIGGGFPYVERDGMKTTVRVGLHNGGHSTIKRVTARLIEIGGQPSVLPLTILNGDHYVSDPMPLDPSDHAMQFIEVFTHVSTPGTPGRLEWGSHHGEATRPESLRTRIVIQVQGEDVRARKMVLIAEVNPEDGSITVREPSASRADA